MAPAVDPQISLPRPGPVLRVTLLALLGVWALFAILVNWGNVGSQVFVALTADSNAIVHGELWRLVTASWLHVPTGTIGHILSALIGLYFLAPPLESAWGSARFARFLFLTGFLAYAFQAVIVQLLGPALGERLVPEHAYGAMPVVEATAIAWACSFRNRIVNLFFVLPVSSKGLILFVVGTSVMYLIAGATPPSGHISLFAGMGLGYLLGGSSPSPLRQLYLRYRLARLEAAVDGERKQRSPGRGLRLIQGGKKKSKSELH